MTAFCLDMFATIQTQMLFSCHQKCSLCASMCIHVSLPKFENSTKKDQK